MGKKRTYYEKSEGSSNRDSKDSTTSTAPFSNFRQSKSKRYSDLIKESDSDNDLEYPSKTSKESQLVLKEETSTNSKDNLNVL